MRNLKKILALVLALVMSLSLMATASAASFPDVADDNAYKTAIDVLNGVKVFQGYDNGARFEPAGNITRAEVAAIIYRISTGDVTDTQKDIYTAWNGAGKLSDVTTGWYAGYVNFCSNAGYIKGYPDGTFKAQNNVTGYEVLAMILRAVGYGKNGEFEGKNWAITTASLAQTLGVTKNVKEDLGAPATRQMVAEILFRAIFCETQKYNALYMYEGTGTNLARENLKLEEVEGVVIANEYAHLYDTDTLADGKTMVRKGEKDYTINYGTTLDDIGESRLIYIQDKTNVISLADSGKNVKDETTEKMKLDDLLSRAGISKSDAETYLNFGQGTSWHSDWKIRYEISLNTMVEKDNPVPEGALDTAIANLLDDDEYDGFVLPSTYKTISGNENYELKTRTEDGKEYYTLVYTVSFRINESIGSNDQKNIIEIFNIADRKGTDTDNAYVAGEVYVGTTSMKDISDTKSLSQFKEEYIVEDEAASVSNNERGNWLKVIDNDGDGKADYILKVIYTFAQVSRVKDSKVTLDVKDHTLTNTNTGKDCDTDAINNLTSQKVVSADELALDDVVYYAIIDGKAQTYKAAMETATFDKVNHNTLVATTTENVEWTESQVHEHIEDEAFMSGVENIAGKVSYDCYFDRGGYLGVLVKTDKTSDFKLITDGWFNSTKTGNEYAVKVYNDETKKIETVDITENGSLFISGRVVGVLNNDWGALRFLGETTGNAATSSASTGLINDTPGSFEAAALNGGVVNAAKNDVRDVIHTAVAAITADGTILPVENSAVSGRYDHAMLDIPDLTAVPTKNPVTGTVYYTAESRNTNTAYDTKYDVSDYDVYALDNTVYYVVYPATVGGIQVVRTVGYANAPDMKSLNEQGIVEDIYAVGTYRERENDIRADYFTADVVVVELSDEPENMGEIVLVVDDVTRSLNVRYRDIVVINEDGEREERRVDWTNNTLAYSDNVSGGKKILPGLYRMAAKSDDLWYISDMLDADEILAADCFDAGFVVKHQWVGQKWIEIHQVRWDGVAEEYVDGDDVRYVVPSTEETPLWYLAYGDDGYDEASLSDTEGHDFVLQAQANDKKNDKSYEPYRETKWDDGHNTHYYNYNKVLLRLDSKGNVVYAVSFENEFKDKSNDKDFAQAVFWNALIPAAEDDTPEGTPVTLTVKLQDGDKVVIPGAEPETLEFDPAHADDGQTVTLYVKNTKTFSFTLKMEAGHLAALVADGGYQIKTLPTDEPNIYDVNVVDLSAALALGDEGNVGVAYTLDAVTAIAAEASKAIGDGTADTITKDDADALADELLAVNQNLVNNDIEVSDGVTVKDAASDTAVEAISEAKANVAVEDAKAEAEAKGEELTAEDTQAVKDAVKEAVATAVAEDPNADSDSINDAIAEATGDALALPTLTKAIEAATAEKYVAAVDTTPAAGYKAAEIAESGADVTEAVGALTTAITTATGVAENDEATTEQITTATTNLNAAVEEYKDAIDALLATTDALNEVDTYEATAIKAMLDANYTTVDTAKTAAKAAINAEDATTEEIQQAVADYKKVVNTILTFGDKVEVTTARLWNTDDGADVGRAPGTALYTTYSVTPGGSADKRTVAVAATGVVEHKNTSGTAKPWVGVAWLINEGDATLTGATENGDAADPAAALAKILVEDTGHTGTEAYGWAEYFASAGGAATNPCTVVITWVVDDVSVAIEYNVTFTVTAADAG